MSRVRVRSLSCPYKGLAAFDSTDADALFFFGRERETEVIAANVMASRFTVLYGPLGVGKSSVLHAGVVRRLHSLAPDALIAVHASWAGDAIGALLGSVAAALDADPPEPGIRLADGLAELATFSGGDVYLVLDQFEELFVYPGASDFAAELAEAATRPDLRVDVLLALREDALSELDVFTGQIPNVFGNYLALDRLDRASARTAITAPVARYNQLEDGRPVEIEDALVEAVLDQVEVGRVRLGARAEPANGARGGAVEAPYLQLVMERLWEVERERGSAVLRRATLEELGGAQAIVRAHLGEAVQALAPEERDLAARIFNHLVTPSGTKIAHGAADLAQYARVDEDELRPVLASLGSSRILRPVDGRYEIFHDVLADAVQAWRAGYEAERTLEHQRAEAERRQRRLLTVLAAALVALAAMAAVTVYALAQRSEAREQAGVARSQARSAKGNELAAQAGRLLPASAAEPDHELGLLLAAEAARLSPSERTADILRRALLVSQLRAVLPGDDATAAAFSPDGSGLVVGAESGTLRFFEASATRPARTMRLDAAVTGAAYSPDGRLLLTTEDGGPARLWDVGDGTALRSLGDAPTGASFSPDGSLVLAFGPSEVRVWRTADGAPMAVVPEGVPVRQASFGADGEHIVTVGSGRVARVFDARTGRQVTSVDHGGSITGVALTANGRLVTTGDDGVARVWSLRRGGGRLVHELARHRGRITAGVVSGDGELLVTTSTDGTARAWALASGLLVATLAGHTNQVTGAAFSREGAEVVTWSTDGTARVWNLTRGSARVTLAGHGDAVTKAAFDPSGERVVTTSANGRARLWSTEVASELELVGGVPRPVSAAAFSADGTTAALAGPAGTQVLSAATGERVALLRTGPVDAVALSGDGALAAVAAGADVEIWRVQTAEPSGAVEAGGGTTALALSADGSRLALGTAAGALRVRDAGGREIELEAFGPGVTSIAFDSSTDRLAAGFQNGVVAAWNLRDGRRLFSNGDHRRGTAVKSVEFGPGGRLVTTGFDSTVRIRDAASGEGLPVLRGHFGSVGDATFSPDARWLVTAGPNVAGLWSLAGGQRLLFLSGHESRVLAASFDGSGRIARTLGADGTLRSYRCEVCGGIPELLKLAERRIAATGRELTAEERRRYLQD